MASETKKAEKLDVALVKNLTGGDPISCRRMNENFWEYWPTHKLHLQSNYKPVITETKDGIWRRVILVPWAIKLPEHEQDKALSAKLWPERSGILNRLVSGCLEWQQQGLAVPSGIKDATAEYRQDQDTLGQFIEDRCLVEDGAFEPARNLYWEYQRWCDATGHRPMTMTTLGRELASRGFQKGKEKGQRGRLGLRLLTSEEREKQGSPPDLRVVDGGLVADLDDDDQVDLADLLADI